MQRAVVVIGGGPAGTYAAIAAKKQDPSSTVTLLTPERCEPYEKPPLSKAVLLGTVSVGDALIAGPAGVAGHDVVLQPEALCTAIDRGSHTVTVADGRRLGYDALVIATGSTPREIPLLPPGMPGVHYLRSEADARALKSELRSGRDLLVVGGGLIGLEVGASAATMGVKVTVLEVAPRILARVCDERTGAVVHAAHARHGVDVRVSTMLASVAAERDGRVAALTNSGERFVSDFVVVGTGSQPDTALAAAAGLATDDGIIVDAHCRTSDSAIFAAGDAVRFPGPRGLVRLENWRHALDQGTVAGRNAAGGSDVYAAVPSFWSEQYDLYIQGVGWAKPESTVVHRQLGGDNVLIFHVSDGRLVHAMGINAQRDLAAARRLIERRVELDVAALENPAQSLAAMVKR